MKEKKLINQRSRLNVQFYPAKYRPVEILLKKVHRLLSLLFIGFVIIAAVVLIDFAGYEPEDIHLFFSETNISAAIGFLNNESPITAELSSYLSLYAGHSAKTSQDSSPHNRESHNAAFINQENPQNSAVVTDLYGIDVSHWQQSIQWQNVAVDTIPHQISFVIMKATQGTDYLDPLFSENWIHANDLFSMAGAYHFYIFKDDPKQQAENFIRNVDLKNGNLPPVVDVENNCSACDTTGISQEQLVQQLGVLLDILADHYGIKPIIYSNRDFYERHLSGHFDEYFFWMAEYSKSPPDGLIGFEPMAGSQQVNPKILMWQFSDSERIDGITGRVNMNYLTTAARNSISFIER